MTSLGRYGTYGTHLALPAPCIRIRCPGIPRNSGVAVVVVVAAVSSLSFSFSFLRCGTEGIRPGHPEIMRCPSIKKSDRRRPLRLSSPSLTVSFLFCVRLRFISNAVPCSYRGMYRGKREGDFYTVFVSLLSKTRLNTTENRGAEAAI